MAAAVVVAAEEAAAAITSPELRVGAPSEFATSGVVGGVIAKLIAPMSANRRDRRTASLVGWVACCLATQLFGVSMCWGNDKAVNPTYPSTALEND